jgi:hypothetical protein
MVLAYLTALATLGSRSLVALERLTDGIQQLLITKRLGKKLHGAAFMARTAIGISP